MFKKFLLALSVVLLMPFATASAAPITYIYSGTANGILDGNGFDQTAFTITAYADTDNIGGWCCSTYQNTHSSATITLAGFGTFDFLFSTHTWMAPNCCMGFGINLSSNLLTLFDSDIVNVGYALDTAFGPEIDFGASTQGQFNNVLTSGGLLSITALISGVTFQAITGQVPEPSIILLMLAGLGGVAVVRRR